MGYFLPDLRGDYFQAVRVAGEFGGADGVSDCTGIEEGRENRGIGVNAIFHWGITSTQ